MVTRATNILTKKSLTNYKESSSPRRFDGVLTTPHNKQINTYTNEHIHK
jgi:hypothetical protein